MNQPGESRPSLTQQSEDRGAPIAGQFVKEMAIFLAGLFIGFFWYMYSTIKKDAEAHIIIGLLVIIFGLARYVMLLKRQRDR